MSAKDLPLQVLNHTFSQANSSLSEFVTTLATAAHNSSTRRWLSGSRYGMRLNTERANAQRRSPHPAR